MKKLITVLCVIAVLLSLSVVAFAAEDTQHGTSTNDGPQMNGQKPSGLPNMIDFDDMVSKGVISQETCDKIKAYLDEHRPADLPEMDGQLPKRNGQTPDMDSQPPQTDGQAPSMGGRPPQRNGRAPGMESQPPQMNGQAPSGDAPADLPELPDMNGELPKTEGATSAKGGLLNDLLNEGIITQAEYDALNEAINK